MFIRNLKDFEKSYLKNFALRKHTLANLLLYSYHLEYDEGLEYGGGNIYNFMDRI